MAQPSFMLTYCQNKNVFIRYIFFCFVANLFVWFWFYQNDFFLGFSLFAFAFAFALTSLSFSFQHTMNAIVESISC